MPTKRESPFAKFSRLREERQKSAELKRIRSRMSLSGEWWRGKTHVLIDMDGTLIGQPGALFHNLFAAFAFFRLRGLAKPADLFRAMRKTYEILLSDHKYKTNEDAFFETLAEELKVTRSKVERFSQNFFDSDYPFICLFLHSEPHARRLLDALHAGQFHVTLATNAVFGRREIELRLKASDLYLHDFDLVTSWDVMKSTKPHSDFFSTTLKMIGATPDSTVMIGNDPYYDLPAHQLGISTLLVGPKLTIEDIANSVDEYIESK